MKFDYIRGDVDIVRGAICDIRVVTVDISWSLQVYTTVL